MEHEFLRTIRSFIFNLRLHIAGMLMWQSAVWLQFLNWRQYLPNFAFTYFHVVMMASLSAVGVSLQIYGMLRINKLKLAPGVTSWCNSLPETKRTYHIMLVALICVVLWLMLILGIGIEDWFIIDYRALIVLTLVSTMWVGYLCEILMPHTMPVPKRSPLD